MKKDCKKVIRAVLWAVSIGIVLIIGICYFPKECDDLNFWGATYYTIRLFILEHDLPHFPKSVPLIFIYFFAPFIALSAVGTVINYFFRFTPALRIRWKSDHVIVCGVGRTGKLIAATLKKHGVSVVGVDSGCPDSFEEWSIENKVPMIYGDFLSRMILEKAGAARSRAIIFASGNDLVNLEGVVGSYSWLRSYKEPIRLLWAHISNEKLADTARSALHTRGSVGIRFFDTYYIAASKMVSKYFTPEVREGVREITILGFGKFGRDLMEVLIRDFKEKHRIIQVIDLQDRENEVRELAEDLYLPEKVFFIRSDIRMLHLAGGKEKAFFLCTDDDIGNLTTALMLTGRMRDTYICVRMTMWPMAAIEDHLCENHGIKFVNINDLVVEGIENLPGIFEPAKASDLKRAR